jgi:hypothetical protein
VILVKVCELIKRDGCVCVRDVMIVYVCVFKRSKDMCFVCVVSENRECVSEFWSDGIFV